MKYRLTTNQIASKVAGEMVILNHKKGEYFGLDDVGVTVWELLEQGPKTIQELCDMVTFQYEVKPATCMEDIGGLIRELMAEKLVEECN